MRANASAGSKRARLSETRGGVTVVVLAAGKGVRMNSRIPKVLHPVAGRPMLLWSMAAPRALAPARTLVVVNPTQDGVQAVLNGEGETVSQAKALGTGHALAQVTGAHRTPGPVVVIYADSPLFRGETLAALLTADLENPRGYGRIVRARNGAVRDIVEEKDATDEQKNIHEVNSGVYVFTGRELWPALAKLEDKNRAGEYYLTDIVRLIKSKIHTLPVEDSNEILGINDRRQLAEAERLMRQRILDSLMTSGITIADPATTFIDADVQIGRDTVVRPFSVISGESTIGEDCVIGPFAQIRDSIIGDACRIERAHVDQSTLAQNVHVGPFSRLRPGSVLDDGVRVGTHAEIKNSHIGAGTAIAHFSAVLDSDVGANANIGAGTVTANFDGVDKHRTAIGDRAQVGSDTILIAPVRVGEDAYTAAGSVITADVPAGSLAIERAEQKIVAGWTERRRGRRKREDST